MTRDTEPAADISALTRALIFVASAFATAAYASAVTVANAVLPQIQGDLSVSLDEISWIITASIAAGAVGTPPTAWLAARFGLRTLMLVCVGGFSCASVLVGLSSSLSELVFARMVQALLGAPIIALSQTLVLDAFPSSRRGFVLSLWSIGLTGGWVFGPAFGAYLAEWEGWRLCFFIFGPVGLLAFILCLAFLPRYPKTSSLQFDWFGFIMLSIALAAVQIVLNRGQRLDWYESAEIVTWTVLGVAGTYFFIVHSFSTRKPFINWSVFRDRNLTVGIIITFAYAYISLAPLVLIPTMLQSLKGLEIVTTGVLLIPRGAAQIFAILLVGPLIDRVDPRILIGLGFASFALGSWMMANYTLDIGLSDVIIPTMFQGLAMAIIWIPTFTLMYSTLAPALRTEAAALVGLIYTIASSLGVAISVTLLSRSVQTNTEELAAYVVPTNELLRFPEYSDGWNLESIDTLASIQSEIAQQALMIGYVNVYWALAVLCVGVLPLIALIRKRA